MTEVAADIDDAGLVPVLLTVADTFAAVTAVTLCATLRPAAARFLGAAAVA